jgi:hypothetical protein
MKPTSATLISGHSIIILTGEDNELNCKMCDKDCAPEDMFTEMVYFMNMGLWCAQCYEKHLTLTNEYKDKTGHWCCHDFRNSKGEYVHYNLPYLGDKLSGVVI